MANKILLVDDEPNVLSGYRRHLRKEFEIETAEGGPAGIEALQAGGPFAVIVSDMRMPEIDGLEFLATAHKIAPDAVRMMLTGNADQRTAVEAVNQGQIFRFLSKPCSPEALAESLRLALEHHRLIVSEKELLTKTLGGSVNLLTEILMLVNPVAFGAASSIRRLAHQICTKLGVDNAWEVEVAAMLSHVGCVTVPEAILGKLTHEIPLSPQERALYQGHPRVGHDLVVRIPRLERVAKIILYQQHRFNESASDETAAAEDEIPRGARILKVASDAAQLLATGKTIDETREVLYHREGWYDAEVLDALESSPNGDYVVKSVTILELSEEMVLDEHVISHGGEILLARGQEVTGALRERLIRFSKSVKGVQEPIKVRCPVRRHAAAVG